MAHRMNRSHYADMFGPTTGDKVRLGDTSLVLEVEKDFATYGDECKFGGGKVIRHYHFIETNAQLRFDRAKAYGKRLDIPAGTAVRFEPGETKTVQLVSIGGARVIRGGNKLADGPVSDPNKAAAMARVREQNFQHREG